MCLQPEESVQSHFVLMQLGNGHGDVAFRPILSRKIRPIRLTITSRLIESMKMKTKLFHFSTEITTIIYSFSFSRSIVMDPNINVEANPSTQSTDPYPSFASNSPISGQDVTTRSSPQGQYSG